MRFAIYIPGDTLPNEQKLQAVGLGHLIPRSNAIAASPGPDGGSGVVFSWPDGNPRSTIAYLPAQQEWIPAVPCGDLPAKRYWVGFMIGHPPTPKDLARGQQTTGLRITLGDGNAWMFPAAANLPKNSVLADSGQWEFVVQEQYAAYFAESYLWYERLAHLLVQNETDTEQTFIIDASAPDYLERALGMNYLLTREVVSRLNLFPTTVLMSALLATVAAHEIQAENDAQKKSDTPPDS